MKRCWHADPSQRPSFEVIESELLLFTVVEGDDDDVDVEEHNDIDVEEDEEDEEDEEEDKGDEFFSTLLEKLLI